MMNMSAMETGDHTFSPVMAKGVLNHCSKLLHDWKIDGRRKFSNAHNSGGLFYGMYITTDYHTNPMTTP